MKRSQRAAGVTGCPVCHRSAAGRVEAEEAAPSEVPVTRTSYVCSTSSCPVVEFTVTRLA